VGQCSLQVGRQICYVKPQNLTLNESQIIIADSAHVVTNQPAKH